MTLGYYYNSNGIQFYYWRSWLNGSTRTGDTYADSTYYDATKWHHAVYVADGPMNYIYVDGQLSKSWDSSSKYTDNFIPLLGASYNRITIGTSAGNPNNRANGLVNDIRIYDHALSPREIKELSKGMILHYKLDRGGFGNDNLLPCGGTYTRENPWTTTLSRVDGYTWVTNSAFMAKPSTTYTISVECDGTLSSAHTGNTNISQKPFTFWAYVSNVDTTKSWSTGQYDTAKNLTSATYNYRKIGNTHVWTIALTSTQKYISLRTNSYSDGETEVTINWWNMKVEEGDTFTPWIPNSADTLYTSMGLNDNVVYDVSGFRHNGERIGTITYSDDTPRYTMSTLFNSNTSYIKISDIITTGFANSYTFSWWGKVPTYSNKMMWGFVNGVRLNGIYHGSLWNTGDGNGNPIYKPGTTTEVSAPTVNVWHHYVMTGNGEKNYLYLDGKLYGESKTYKEISGTIIFINGWDAGTSYKYTDDFYISDFRIYATCLSELDV